MQVPREIEVFAQVLHFGEDVSIETAVAEAAEILKGEDKVKALRFLDEILDDHLDDDALHQLWRTADSNLDFDRPEGARVMFQLMRDALRGAAR